jgi:hypothetical protein
LVHTDWHENYHCLHIMYNKLILGDVNIHTTAIMQETDRCKNMYFSLNLSNFVECVWWKCYESWFISSTFSWTYCVWVILLGIFKKKFVKPAQMYRPLTKRLPSSVLCIHRKNTLCDPEHVRKYKDSELMKNIWLDLIYYAFSQSIQG